MQYWLAMDLRLPLGRRLQHRVEAQAVGVLLFLNLGMGMEMSAQAQLECKGFRLAAPSPASSCQRSLRFRCRRRYHRGKVIQTGLPLHQACPFPLCERGWGRPGQACLRRRSSLPPAPLPLRLRLVPFLQQLRESSLRYLYL